MGHGVHVCVSMVETQKEKKHETKQMDSVATAFYIDVGDPLEASLEEGWVVCGPEAWNCSPSASQGAHHTGWPTSIPPRPHT